MSHPSQGWTTKLFNRFVTSTFLMKKNTCKIRKLFKDRIANLNANGFCVWFIFNLSQHRALETAGFRRAYRKTIILRTKPSAPRAARRAASLDSLICPPLLSSLSAQLSMRAPSCKAPWYRSHFV